ncbi:MAG: carbon-nitrogen hydrolase [Planctomycetota bacterium]|nr:MAG: carbon-nitrogen hydrolase [Planctomycetota bacterium]REK21736.1 MAG: carbon-nitrogen hydrolase [Planctomycetota bacterium]
MAIVGEKAIAEQGRTDVERAPAADERADTYRIALAQTAPALGVVDANHNDHLEKIAAARAARADLVVFPELSLTGYFLRDMVPDVAMAADAPRLGDLAAAAKGAAVVAGFVEESPRHRFYNSACYLENGVIAHVHRKVYLPTYGLFDESRYFAAGERIEAFDTTRLGRVGLLVCEDFWHLSAAAIMQAEQVDLLICVANSPARGVSGDQIDTAATYKRLCRTYAELIGCVVVMVNRVGYEDGLCFWGGSLVVGPDGEIHGEAPLLDESLTIVEFNAADLRRQRLTTPLGRDEQLLLTIEELNRIKRDRYRD